MWYERQSCKCEINLHAKRLLNDDTGSKCVHERGQRATTTMMQAVRSHRRDGKAMGRQAGVSAEKVSWGEKRSESAEKMKRERGHNIQMADWDLAS